VSRCQRRSQFPPRLQCTREEGHNYACWYNSEEAAEQGDDPMDEPVTIVSNMPQRSKHITVITKASLECPGGKITLAELEEYAALLRAKGCSDGHAIFQSAPLRTEIRCSD
jgi:hypothetical protein